MARGCIHTMTTTSHNWCPYWSTYALHTYVCNLILEIQFMVSWQLSNQGIRWLVSTTWPHCGFTLELIEVKFFFKLTTDQVVDFHWIAGSSFFQIIRTSQRTGALLLGLAKSISILLSNCMYISYHNQTCSSNLIGFEDWPSVPFYYHWDPEIILQKRKRKTKRKIEKTF